MASQLNFNQASTEDPIVALASGHGSSAIAIIRLTGPETHSKLSPLLTHPPRTLRYASLSGFVDAGDKSRVIDSLLVLYFGAGASFTGEESAELQCHGSPYIVREILRILQGVGFRLAEPGEFTKRAYLNGKLDLTQAEGIKELVEAQTEAQWYAATQLTKGNLSTLVSSIRAQLIHAMSYLEARIDFPDEEETSAVELAKVKGLVEDVESTLMQLTNSFASGQVATKGLRVGLLGEPNAGKSTLLNKLLGRQRAIVTDIAGTTRDYLEESTVINGHLIRLVDTAGIRDTTDKVEQLGVEQTHLVAAESDLILILLPATMTSKQAEDFLTSTAGIPTAKKITIVTKSDLGQPNWGQKLLSISCSAEQGLSALKQVLTDACERHFQHIKGNPFVTNSRHLAALDQSKTALERFHTALGRQEFEECLAFELQAAAAALQTIVGEISTDDLLDRIFADFCIGK
jgi:tRNA modification GTPase